MKAVITVVGADRTGILALVASECAARNCNILDVSQTIVDGVFTMTMIADMDGLTESFEAFAEHMEAVGDSNDLAVRVMNRAIFKAMHSI
ncbi:ACT domain-containing protein [uncultured Faecalibaculum sp.]|uniref:ACT domain-containing protein n=1 Tax=uncultured Faecalibaculum sp. TaxID=1729681 RepID=UPI0025F93201|nr:ACT domain-containing protein [uncultured Faecalibaculum sp.]